MCLRLLHSHLKLSSNGSLSASSVLRSDSRNLRLALFRIIDLDAPEEIKEVKMKDY